MNYILNEADASKLEKSLNRIPESLSLATEEAALQIARYYKDAIQAVHAVDKGDLLEAVGVKLNAGHIINGGKTVKDIVIQSDVNEAWFIEFGVAGKNYPGRKPLEHAVTRFDNADDLERFITSEFDKILGDK